MQLVKVHIHDVFENGDNWEIKVLLEVDAQDASLDGFEIWYDKTVAKSSVAADIEFSDWETTLQAEAQTMVGKL